MSKAEEREWVNRDYQIAGKIHTQPPSEAYSEGWERTFGKKDRIADPCQYFGKRKVCEKRDCPSILSCYAKEEK